MEYEPTGQGCSTLALTVTACTPNVAPVVERETTVMHVVRVWAVSKGVPSNEASVRFRENVKDCGTPLFAGRVWARPGLVVELSYANQGGTAAEELVIASAVCPE